MEGRRVAMATTYNVYRDGAKIKSGLTTTTFTDTGLAAGKEYAYQVSSVNEVGESPLSEKVFVTIRSVTLDVNGTVKTGTFAEKTLDEDAYDDLTKKDSNTIYKVYPENGNPDEAAWFLGEHPVDSAKEGDTVVYGRNYAGDWIHNTVNNSGTPLKVVADGLEVAFTGTSGNYISLKGMHQPKKIGEYTSSILTTLQDTSAKDFKFGLRSDGESGSDAKDITVSIAPLQPTIVRQIRDISSEKLSNGLFNIVSAGNTTNAYTVVIDKLKVERGTEVTTYTVAPEDVAIFTEATGGGAA